MPKPPDCRIDKDDYLLEAIDVFLLLADSDGVKGEFYREAGGKAVLVALDLYEPRISDRERLNALFDRAIEAI